MIYNIEQLGVNAIIGNYVISISDPYFLGVFKVPCYSGLSGQSKNVLIASVDCGNEYTFTITGTAEAYEDLESSEVYFSAVGTWDVDLYYQASSTNTDPTNATFLETINLQVTDG